MKSEKSRKFFSNPWTVGFGVAIFSFILTIIGDVVKGEQILSTFVNVVTWIWKVLIIFLTFKIKVWWILIGVGLLIFGLWIYSKVLDKKDEKTPAVPFLDYTQDFLLGYKWEWMWRKDSYGKYAIESLRPICSKCNTPIVDNTVEYGGLYICLRCNEAFHKPLPDFDHVELLIRDNAKRKCEKQSV